MLEKHHSIEQSSFDRDAGAAPAKPKETRPPMRFGSPLAHFTDQEAVPYPSGPLAVRPQVPLREIPPLFLTVCKPLLVSG